MKNNIQNNIKFNEHQILTIKDILLCLSHTMRKTIDRRYKHLESLLSRLEKFYNRSTL